MATFLDYLHGHVFVYIALAVLIAIGCSALLSRKEQRAVFSSGDPLAGAPAGRAPFWVVLVSVALAWVWIVLMPIGYGHRDEIALLTQPLQPTMYSGRFFPLGHMEFNLISLSLTEGALEPLYILPFLQLLAVIFFIDRIVSPAGALVRIYAMALSFLVALVVPFVNLIVPERNAIFFLLASLYFIKRYREVPGFLMVALAVASAAISLYYKEPMFALWVGVAFGLFCYDFGSLVRHAREPLAKGDVPRLLGSIQLGLSLSTVFFVLGYIFFVFYKGAPESYYAGGGGGAGLPDRFLTFVRDVPLLTVLILTGVGAHLFIPRNSFDRGLTVALCIGGVGYLSALIVLSLPLNGYYYAIPVLLQVICSAILLKHLAAVLFGASGRSVKVLLSMGFAAVFGAGLVYGVFAVTKGVYNYVRIDIATKKNYHAEYAFIYSELKAQGDIRSVYYAPRTTRYNDYSTAVLMTFIHTAGVDHQFDIYSESGCAVWNESYNGGLIHCVKKDFNNVDDYDVLVIENDSLADLDKSKYRVLKLDSPFEGRDDQRGSIVIAVRQGKQ